MRKGQYRKLKEQLHGRNNYGEQVKCYEYHTCAYTKSKITGPIRLVRKRINKLKRILSVDYSLRPSSSYSLEDDCIKRCSKIKRLRLSVAPCTSFDGAVVYDFTNEELNASGARVFKLHRKGE